MQAEAAEAETQRRLLELEVEEQRRNLATPSFMEGGAGVHVKHENSFVALGADGDVSLQRVSESQMLVNNSVTICGDLELCSGQDLTLIDESTGQHVNVLQVLDNTCSC